MWADVVFSSSHLLLLGIEMVFFEILKIMLGGGGNSLLGYSNFLFPPLPSLSADMTFGVFIYQVIIDQHGKSLYRWFVICYRKRWRRTRRALKPLKNSNDNDNTGGI